MLAFFDLGTVTGYALCPGASGCNLLTGVWNFRPSRFEGGGMRFLRFRGKLLEAHTNAPFAEVYFEEVRRHLGTDAAHVYGGLLATLTAFCEEHKVPYEGVPVQHIKKSFTGRGNAKKVEMIAEAQRLGFSTTDENEADAIALAKMKLVERGRWS